MLFICPNCEQKSEVAADAVSQKLTPHICPHCGSEFKIDNEINVIVEN